MSRKYKFVDQTELYFTTSSVIYWIDAFTRTEYKDILVESLRYCQQEKDLNSHAWCLMTDHLHLIISTRGRRMEETLRDTKQFTVKRILAAIEENPVEGRKEWLLWMFERAGQKKAGNDKYQFWQHDNHPVVLFTPPIMQQKLDYLHNNPVKAGFVCHPEEWLYSSAKNYYTTEMPLLEVMLLV